MQLLVHLVHAAADIAAHQSADDGAGDGGGGLAAAAADLGARRGARRAAEKRAEDLAVAAADAAAAVGNPHQVLRRHLVIPPVAVITVLGAIAPRRRPGRRSTAFYLV